MSLFIPDLYKKTIYDIPIDYFISKNISLLFVDIDNTLVTYDDEKPSEKNLEWFELLRSNGIEVVFVSNNKKERVSRFASSTGFSYYADVGKPSFSVHKKIMRERGLLPSQCASIGDQIFTDVLAGHLAGCIAVMVFPIKDVTTLFNKFKRLCERPFMRAYAKMHTEDEI